LGAPFCSLFARLGKTHWEKHLIRTRIVLLLLCLIGG
jgi:hypothetical protein